MDPIIDKWRSRWENAILEVMMMKAIMINPRYGRELIDMARNKISLDIRIPTVYAILNRNLKENLLSDFTAKSKSSQTRGTERRYYKLTKKGLKFTVSLIKQLDDSTPILNEIKNLELEAGF